MSLYLVHRIVIAMAVAAGACFAIFSLYRFKATGDPLHILLGTVSVTAALALVIYLRWFLVRHPRAPAPTRS